LNCPAAAYGSLATKRKGHSREPVIPNKVRGVRNLSFAFFCFELPPTIVGGNMPSTVWKGYISFGLISMPIRLFAAARSEHTQLHEIHRECGTRIHHPLYCPYDERMVTREEVAMGYEVEKDKYVLIEPAELKKTLPPSSKVMEILQFVKLDEVDPIYFDSSYFAVPDQAGQRAYALLLRTMEVMQYAAIAKITLHQRERTAIIRPYRQGLTLHTFFYANDIHAIKEYGKTSVKDLKKQEIALGEQFAKTLVKPFRPEEFHDQHDAQVKKLIEQKRKGGSAPKTEKAKQIAPVIDLMSALKKSIANVPSAGSGKSKKLRKTA
jgi:DNA end-binding protein Ku